LGLKLGLVDGVGSSGGSGLLDGEGLK